MHGVPVLIVSVLIALAAVIALVVFALGRSAHEKPSGPVPAAPALTGPWAAPYDYLGASALPPPVQVMAAGVRRLTLAFIVSGGACNPVWDNGDPLAGGSEQAAVRSVRAGGGDVAISVGGMGGTKLGLTCSSPAALAGAYQKVIGAYRLRAIDIDIEDTEIASAAARQRVIGALAIVRRDNPGLFISITIGSEVTGPDADGRDLIARAAAAGLHVGAWTIMPFDFAARVADMGQATVQAAEALKNDLMSAYDEPASAAYLTMGISSMNGRTDTGETVSTADFETMLRYVQAHHLARFAFWSVNRDRPCAQGSDADTCSGIAQAPYAFSRIVARYQG